MFLSLGLKPDADPVGQWLEYAEYYRIQIITALSGKDEAILDKFRDKRLFMRILYYMLFEVFVNRVCAMTYVPNDDKRIPIEDWLKSNLAYVSVAGKHLGLDI